MLEWCGIQLYNNHACSKNYSSVKLLEFLLKNSTTSDE